MRYSRSPVANAEDIARALDGKKCGNGWSARCPAHNDHNRSLSIGEGHDSRVLLHCFAGCHQGDVIAAVKARGLWPERRGTPSPARWPDVMTVDRGISLDTRGRELALSILEASKPGGGTLVQTYLESRDICLPPPPSLRFHPGLKHPGGDVWPAMVGLITRGPDETLVGIHRTFLARDGVGKAPVEPSKMILGSFLGGALRLGSVCDHPRGRPLIIGEGLETVMSAMQLWRLPGWSALCANGVASLDIVGLPDEIVIAADNDPVGLRAAGDFHQRVNATSKRARVMIPDARHKDFNALLR
jgi:hypothetical protein